LPSDHATGRNPADRATPGTRQKRASETGPHKTQARLGKHRRRFRLQRPVRVWLDAAGLAVSEQAEADYFWHLLLTRS
jgi:hypothetical protein